MKNARITISKPSDTRGRSCIAIQIEDEDSNLVVLRVEMGLAEFADALTGHGHMLAKVDHWIGKYACRIGMKREVKHLLLTGRPPDRKDAEWVLSHPELNAALVDGWTLNDDGLRRQQNERDKHIVTLERYL